MISPSVTNGNRSVGMMSLIGITAGGGYALRLGHCGQWRVVAVDGLRPGLDGPTDRHLKYVRREPAVGHAQVQRGGARIAVEVKVGHLGHGCTRGRRRGDGALDERLVPEGL